MNDLYPAFLLLLIVGAIDCSRILVFYPGVAGSLLLSFSRLFQELESRGHHLTIVTGYRLTSLDKLDNVTQLIIPLTDLDEKHNGFKDSINQKQNTVRWVKFYWDTALLTCDNMMDQPFLNEILNFKEPFDLFIGTPFHYHECDIVVAHLLQLPVVNISPNRMSIHLTHQLGHSFPSSYVAEFNLPFKNDMNFFQRAVNLAFSLGYSAALSWYYLPRMDALVHRRFPDLPPISEMLSSVSVTLLNTDLAVHPPQPLPPGVIPIGGLTVSDKVELPEELDRWMNESRGGVVLFTTGSFLPASALDCERLDALFLAFGRLNKLRVLMKWETDVHPDNKPDNVRLEKWIPQTAVLAHCHCRAFATHGGIHGWMEAVYHAVPIVGLTPVFYDQKHNLEEMQARGHGIRYDGPWTADGLYEAFNEVISNPRYKESISHASRLFRDQPMPPLQRAVYWTEYALRHGGARHLSPASARMPWHQTALLDVAAAATACATILALLALFVVRIVKRTVSGFLRKVAKAKGD